MRAFALTAWFLSGDSDGPRTVWEWVRAWRKAPIEFAFWVSPSALAGAVFGLVWSEGEGIHAAQVSPLRALRED